MKSYRNRASANRGAALILEIIIYLVIVALIAVAVTSGVRATRDLVFTSHAKGDIKQLQEWMESKYSQDGFYPGVPGGHPLTSSSGYNDLPRNTVINGFSNHIYGSSIGGAQAGYCILVYSVTISDQNKIRFWLSSSEPNVIHQSGTATNNFSMEAPDSGIPGVTCRL